MKLIKEGECSSSAFIIKEGDCVLMSSRNPARTKVLEGKMHFNS